MSRLQDATNRLSRSLIWEIVINDLRYIHKLKGGIHGSDELPMLRRRIERDGGTASTEQLVELIDMYPKELASSLLLCTLRFPVHSTILMDKIFQAIEDEINANTVIGEAISCFFLIFSRLDDFVATHKPGNLRALCLVKQRYPRSILYVDKDGFTPLHGVCGVLSMDIFRFFINWHLEQDPEGRGGLYCMNDSKMTSMDTLIDTQQDIVPQLTWLLRHKLLKTEDVKECFLVHKSAHMSPRETIEFFIGLYPSGVMIEDKKGNLPITLHVGVRVLFGNGITDEDYAITKLLITKGIEYGGIDTIGGLFHREPDKEKSCTLDALLKEVGEASHKKLWGMIDNWIEEATCGDYTFAPIVLAALQNKEHMSDELFEYVMFEYVMTEYATNESNED